jgi:hypothetical protein
MMIERNVEGLLPSTPTLDQTGVFVETSDLPAPHAGHRYTWDGDIDGLATYRHVGTHRGGEPH